MAARAISSYKVGQSVKVSCTFTDEAGSNVDPDSVTLKIQDPDGVETTPTPQNPSTGVYYALVLADKPGAWIYRWEGSGGTYPESADEHQFMAEETEF